MAWERVLASVAITRLYTVIPLALLAYGVAVAATVRESDAFAAAAAIASAVAGGYAYNDLRDQRLDRLNRPRRPPISGGISEQYARRLTAGLFAAALLLAASTRSWRTMLFVVLLIASAAAYSDHLKFVPALKNAFVGAWCGLLPWGAAWEEIDPATALPAIAIIGTFILQKEILADVYDLEGDAAAGVKTIPGAIGRRGALALVAVLNALLWLLADGVAGVPILIPLPTAAATVAAVNVLTLLLVLLRPTPRTIRAELELQKFFLIGGCLGLFVLLARAH
jgi:geranylgeranylglycerol-phosphate geranylgeranyltransferase